MPCNTNCSTPCGSCKHKRVIKGDLTVCGNISVNGDSHLESLCIGSNVAPSNGENEDGLRNGEKLFVNVFNDSENNGSNPYFPRQAPYNFITQMIPNQTYRNSSSVSMENNSVYFNQTLESDTANAVYQPASTEVFQIPIVMICPLTKEIPSHWYKQRQLDPADGLILASDPNNFTGANLVQQFTYAPDDTLIISNTVNTNSLKLVVEETNLALRANTSVIKYLPDPRNPIQLAAAKIAAQYDFNEFDLREQIADTGLELVLEPSLTWDIKEDVTDMYRVYATTTSANSVAVWSVPQEDLADEFTFQGSIDDPVVQANLNNDYANSVHTLTAENGICSAEFRIQYRSHVNSVVNGVLTAGSVTSLNVIEPGKGYTQQPDSVSSNYIRTIIGFVPEPSKSGFDDACISCKTEGSSPAVPDGQGGAPLDPAEVTIEYAGSGYIDGVYDVEFVDSVQNAYVANNCGVYPTGQATVVGGVVTSVVITEPSCYLYPKVWGRLVGNCRDFADISVSLNPDSSLSYTLNTGGSGYTSIPNFFVVGGSTEINFARASATISGGVITAITVTESGAGYIAGNYTTINIVDLDGPGIGATATATIVNGGVQINLTNGGAGYSNNVEVQINGGRPWIYSSRMVDYFITNLASVFYNQIKIPNGFTIIGVSATAYSAWDTSPINPDGTFNEGANMLFPGSQTSFFWSWLPKLYQYKVDYPNNTLADYLNDSPTYIPDTVLGDIYPPLLGSFDRTRWINFDLSGAMQLPVARLFNYGHMYQFFDQTNEIFHRANALVYSVTQFDDPYDQDDFFLQIVTIDELLTIPGYSFKEASTIRAWIPITVAHEFGHSFGLGHTESSDQLFSTGVGLNDDFFSSDLSLNTESSNFMKYLYPDNILFKEDGSSQIAASYNIMSYEPYPVIFTKEQRYVMRWFLANQHPDFVANVIPNNVNTGYLDFYDNSPEPKQIINDIESAKIRSSSVISDKIQSRNVEADYINVNGLSKSQMCKSELVIADQIVLGNNGKRIYIDDNGKLVLGDITVYVEDGCVKFEPTPTENRGVRSLKSKVTKKHVDHRKIRD